MSIINHLSIRNERRSFGILLALLFVVFSLTYVPAVIAPQVGWWQYFAWRMECGDVLYKDVYMFLPPYFVFLTDLLYKLFHEHFVLYTWLVGYPLKLATILLVYGVICRFAKPVYALVGVFTAYCISATYPMELGYDYNPVVTFPCVLVAYLLMRFYERLLSGQGVRWLAFAVGVLFSIVMVLKHTFGITFLIAFGVISCVIYYREYQGSAKTFLRQHALIGAGMLVGALPLIWYLTVHSCWTDFFRCLSGNANAKGSLLHMLFRWVLIFSEIKIWVYILIITVVARLLRKWKPELSGGTSRLRTPYVWMTLALIFCVAIWLYAQMPETFHGDVSEMPFVMKWKGRFYKIFTYGAFIYWIVKLYRYFIKREQLHPVLILGTLIAVHFLTGLLTTEQYEELFVQIYVPWGVCLALQYGMHPRQLVVKNALLMVCCVLVILSCISIKRHLPYSWQGWKEPPVTAQNVWSTVRGLEGHSLPPEVERSFNDIVQLIETHTTPEDKVFQFASIPLFNVLTKREIPTYSPITWPDVCPDDVAVLVAKQLRQDPPKMIIWHEMGSDVWNVLEKFFRNGRRSGQREIQEFFRDKQREGLYRCLYRMDNHHDGMIEVWVRQ